MRGACSLLLRGAWRTRAQEPLGEADPEEVKRRLAALAKKSAAKGGGGGSSSEQAKAKAAAVAAAEAKARAAKAKKGQDRSKFNQAPPGR